MESDLSSTIYFVVLIHCIFYFAFYCFSEEQGIGTAQLNQNNNCSSTVLYLRQGSVLETSTKPRVKKKEKACDQE